MPPDGPGTAIKVTGLDVYSPGVSSVSGFRPTKM